MGAVCCRDGNAAEKYTEDSGKYAAQRTGDESVPAYAAGPPPDAAPNSLDTLAFALNDYQNDDGGVPPPPADDVPAPEAPAPKADDKPKAKKQTSKQTSGLKAEEVPKVQEVAPATAPADPSVPPATQPSDQTGKEPEKPLDLGPADKVFGFPGMFLQVYLDTAWADNGEDETKQISGHLKSGVKKFGITSRGSMYVVDFTDPKNITQLNPQTKKSRALRLMSDSATPAERAAGLPAAPKEGAAAAGDATGKPDDAATKKKSGCCVVS